MVAICVRWLFEALVTMENSTGEPAPSINVPSGFQEKPADCNIFRAWSTERAGCGIAVSIQNLLAGVTGVQSGVARPRYTRRVMPSRSIAKETAWRNLTCRNQFCLRVISPDWAGTVAFRLKKRKLYSRLGPRSSRWIDWLRSRTDASAALRRLIMSVSPA